MVTDVRHKIHNPFDSPEDNAIVWLFRFLPERDIKEHKGIRTRYIRYVLGAPLKKHVGRPMSAEKKNGQDRDQQPAPDGQIYEILERMSRRWGGMAERRLEDLASFLEYLPKSKISRKEEEELHFIEGNLTSFLVYGLCRKDARLQGKDFERFAKICFAVVSRQGGNHWFEQMTLFLRLHEIILREEWLGIWTSANRLAFPRKCRAAKNRTKNAKRVLADYIAQYVRRHCAKLERLGFLKAHGGRGRGRSVSYFHGPNLWTDPYRWFEIKKSLNKTHLDDTRTEKAVSLVGTSPLADVQEEHNIIARLNEEAKSHRDRWLLAELSERLPPSEKKEAGRDLSPREIQAMIKARVNRGLQALDKAIADTLSRLIEPIDQLAPKEQEKLDAAVRKRINEMRNEFRQKLPGFDPPLSLPDLPLIVIDLNSLAFEKF